MDQTASEGGTALPQLNLRCPKGAKSVEENKLPQSPLFGKSVYCVKNGIREGPFITYYTSGEKLNEGTYRQGLLHGWNFNYYKNGKKMSAGEYKNGTATGSSISWNENGIISEEITPLNSFGLVRIITWHANARKQRQLTAMNNRPCGMILSWSESGLPETADPYFSRFDCVPRADGALCPPCTAGSKEQ